MNTYKIATRGQPSVYLPNPLVTPGAKASLLLLMPPLPLTTVLQDNLKQAGYDIRLVQTSYELQRLLQKDSFDLILLYLAQADSDTFDLCVTVRDHSYIPLVLLSEQKSLQDMICGLSLGADAYLAMPFSIAELDLRIQATLRRAGKGHYRYHPLSVASPLTLDHDRQSIKIWDREIELTRIEYQLLSYMFEQPNTALTKQQLAEIVWGFSEGDNFNFIEVTMWRLRKKLEEDPTNPEYLVTVRGVGYQLVLPSVKKLNVQPVKLAA